MTETSNARIDGGAPVVIDLGLDRDEVIGESGAGPRWWTVRRWRKAATAVGAALLLLLGGSAAPGPPPLTEIAALTVAPDRSFVLTPDRLYVAADTDETGQFASAYETGRGRLLWTTEYDPGLSPGGLVERIGDLLLTRVLRDNAPHTTAVDARTGTVRWSVPGQVEVLADDRTGLTSEDVFPADARPVQSSSPVSGSTYYSSSSGQTYLVPPVGQVVHLLDLASGRSLWDSPPLSVVLSTRVPASAPDGDLLLVVTTTDHRVEVRDARTGTVRRSLPAVGTGQPTMQVLGDLLMVQRTNGVVTGYDVDSLAVRWTRTLDGPELLIGVCGDQPCLGNSSGWWPIDPGTGADNGGSHYPERRLLRNGGQLFEVDREEAKLVRTVDPSTGRTLADLAGWETMTYAASPGPVLLIRQVTAAGPTWFGLLEPEASEVRPLARVPHRALECQLAGDVIACQDRSDVLRLWRYQP